MLGFAPIYWLVRLLGAAPDTAVQWWMLIVYGLNFFATYALLRLGLKVGILASTAGALLLAMILVTWLSHIQLFPFFYVMLALLALFQIFDEEEPDVIMRRVWIGVFCACGVLQVWGAVYAFFFFMLLTAIAVGVALAHPQTRSIFVQHFRRDAGTWFLFLALSAAAMAPLINHYVSTAAETGYRDFYLKSVAFPSSWIATRPGDPILGWLSKGSHL